MNFDFLEGISGFETLHSFCKDAEDFVYSKPNFSAVCARSAIEYLVHLIYANDLPGIDIKGKKLADLLTNPVFVNYVNWPLFIDELHNIRKLGNRGAHAADVTSPETIDNLEQLYHVVTSYLDIAEVVSIKDPFVKPIEETPGPEEPKSVAMDPIPTPEIIAELAPRLRKVHFDTSEGRDEGVNKQIFIRSSLRDANWPIVNKPNVLLPACATMNFVLDDGDTVDYVLNGRDNKPLAIIEYTSTNQNIILGRKKAIKKASDIEAKFGYKPIIYYTNGYMIYIIDQLGYAPRRVFTYHTIDELELLKARAGMMQDISHPVIDDAITNRGYQKNAIRATCEAFSKMRRHSLLVMATGTGKTRVSISLIDILMKANWAKNVLFLADRTSLVRQAHKNFTKLLPSVTTSVYSGGSLNRDANARIIFSTYQTMLGLINDETREFSIGRFDLIVVDEAHRSIFRKYKSLFEYFDALMIGLTATPRSEENKSSYEIFNLPNGCPDYAYELEEAVNDGYLVGFTVYDRTTAALKRGVHYDELSPEEKAKIEDAFSESEEVDPNDLTGVVIGSEGSSVDKRNIINLGTIDIILGDLMKNGLKVEGGDKLGKSIIFARNHAEAEQIVLRFQHLYPSCGPDFCKLIDSQVPGNLSLVDSFGVREQMPQIAVSVDMMDTGIDVPDILNLVFFKTVKSKIKFLQMIGRGTRLSPDVYGPGMDKKGFVIFDYYDNFEYFSTKGTWSTVGDNGDESAMTSISITERLNQRRLTILRYLLDNKPIIPFDVQYKDDLKKYFIDKTQSLCNDDIDVQHNMSYVTKYRTASIWDSINDDKEKEIIEHIIPLYPSEPEPARVKMFDNHILAVECVVPRKIDEGDDPHRLRAFERIDKMLKKLKKMKSIPAVAKKEMEIDRLMGGDYLCDDFSFEKCESTRKELRDLMQYIPDEKTYYIIDIEDTMGDKALDPKKAEKPYAEKVMEYINSNPPSILKIMNLESLTDEEKNQLEEMFKSKLGTSADYAKLTDKPLLVYIRSKVGIADSAISTQFGSMLSSPILTPDQVDYLKQIIQYAKENGNIAFTDLTTVEPFSEIEVVALFGTNIKYVKDLVNGLRNPIK